MRNEFIPAGEMKYYFSAADLVAQTYRTASQSGISQLAYHFDCPLLVTNVGGLSEMVPHKKVGYVVDTTPQAIAGAVCDFYDQQRAVDFIHNLQQEKKKYSWDAFASQVVQWIQSL